MPLQVYPEGEVASVYEGLVIFAPVGGAISLLVGIVSLWFHCFIVANLGAYATRPIKVIDVMPLWVKSDMTKDIEVTSIDRLGINLTVDDVAKKLCQLSSRPNRKISKTHYAIGFPARVLQNVSQVTPDSIIRFFNKKVGAK